MFVHAHKYGRDFFQLFPNSSRKTSSYTRSLNPSRKKSKNCFGSRCLQIKQKMTDILSLKVDEIKSAKWDIEVPDKKIKGREWLKSQVSRAFLPKYFPKYEKYLWIDCDAWVNNWETIELYLKACDNGKLGITQTIGPGYKITSRFLFQGISLHKHCLYSI